MHADDLASIKQEFQVDVLSDLYDKNLEQLKNKDDEIAFLQNEIKRISFRGVANQKLAKLAQSQFDIEEIAFENLVYSSQGNQDTIPTAVVSWEKWDKFFIQG